jgi:glutaredoxin
MKIKSIFILFTLVLFLAGCKEETTNENGTISTANVSGQKTVIVYGAPWCSSCENLKTSLNSNNISFEAQNTDNADVDAVLTSKLVNGGFINAGEDYPIPVSEVDGEILFGSESNLATIQSRL